MAAERLGISLRRFEGWEPVTLYVHDGAGRLASSTPEPEWDDTEQGWMLALQLYRDGRCPGCGGNLEVTAASENEDRFRHRLPLQCFRCVAFAQSHEAYSREPRPQTLIHLVPTTAGG